MKTIPLSKSVFKATALSLAIILTVNPLLVVAADLTVAPNSGNTQITQAGNGVPMVNINTPNANGLSHNKFTDYNVGKQGLILNNNNTKYTNTQLGGTIEFNPNLKGQNAANTILNEVTSGNASRLQGYTEVAGQKAHVIVANPNGVTCSGCGFINTPRVTITTGKPIIENGQVNRYDINQGKVTIEGEGLNAGNVSQFDILSRSAQINAEIHAQALNIIAGQNEVSNADLTVTAKTTTDQTNKPQLAIDSSALGGMYAGAIRLVGTEKGVGVNLAGDMASNSGNIQLDANGKLTVGGSLAANKNIVAKAEQIEINNTAYAANDINVTSQQVTINKSLTSGNNLMVNAEKLTNQGSIEAGATKTGSGNNINAKLTLNTKQLNNQGKTITSRGSLDINADTLANQQGKIISKSNANITAKQINNQQGSLAAEGKLTLQAEIINNQQGNIVGQQGTTITAHSVDNSQQGLIYSEQGDINLTATQVNNQQGNIAGQNLTATIDTLDNQQGLIEASQGINYQGETIQNNTGTIHALGKQNSQINLSGVLNNQQGKIGVNSNTFALVADQINNTDGSITHAGNQGFTIDYDLLGLAGGTVTTQSAIHINQDDWYNNTDIQAADFTLNVKNLTQATGGKLYLQGSLTVTEGGDWYNDGLIQTNGAIDLNLQGDYWGTGQLLSQNHINLNADNIILDDTTARIQGNGVLNLTANNQLYNEGNILSDSTLQLSALELVNLGTIGASQDLGIIGQSLHNQDGLIFTSGKLNIQSDDFYNQRGDLYAHADIDLVGYSQQAMKTLTNHSGVIESLAKININADILENAREIFNIVTHKISINLEDLGPESDGSGSKQDRNYQLTEVDRTEVIEASAEAKIVAADDLTIQSKQIDNTFSVLASGNNIQIDTTTFNNIGAQTGDITTSRFTHIDRTTSIGSVFALVNEINRYSNQDSPDYDPNRNFENDVSRFMAWVAREIVTQAPTLTNAEAHNGIVQATGTVTINAKDGEIANNSIKPSYIYISGGDRVQDTNTLGNDIATYVPVNSQLKPDTTHNATDPLQLPGFSLPNNINGLFHVNTNPNHKYLVETNPAFGVKSFINSDYLLSKLGYDPDEAQRRLGDGMYEQRLIQQAITARTGQYFVNGMTDGDQLYQYLMDNAIASKEALKLTVGVGLTAEQVAALTHDIVWLEEREVQGQKVLVPILYMAQTEGRLAPTGSLIQGYDLSLIAGNNLTNTGTLQADQSIQARAKNVINGGLFETNQLAINATDNIINTNGGIIKGQRVDLTAENGSILNQRTVTTHESVTSNTYHREDFISEASAIESDNGLTLRAGQDIINQGSNIKANTADLKAGGNIQITSTEQQQAHTIQGKHASQTQTIKQLGSQIAIDSDLNVNAGKNIQITASTISAGNSATLAAGNDITINAAANEGHSSYKSKKLTVQSDSVQQQQSEIKTNNLKVTANHDLNLGAATIDSKEAYLYAGNQIKAEAQQDSSYYLYDKKTGGSGSFSQKATKRDEVTDIKNVSATFNVSNNLTLKSGGDQSYQAITINTPKGESAGTVTFDSGGNIVFESVKDYHQESHEKSKSDWSWNSAKGKGQTDETFKQTTIIGDAKVVIKAVDGLKLDIKDNGITPQTVDQAIDVMVKADPNLMWIKEAQKNGDIDYNAVKEIHDKWKYESSSLGVGASLVIAIAAAAVAGPAAAGAITGAGAGTTAAAMGGAVAGSMAGTSAVSLVNNKGNLGNTLKDTFSSDNLKNYAIAGITAGITAGVIDANLGGKSDAINKTTSGFDLNDWSLTAGKSNGLQGFIVHQGAQAVNEATVGTIINGGSLGDNLVNALKNHAYESGQAIGFNQVGNWGQANGYESGSPGKIIGHAVVGGTANVIMGGNFTDGAAAAGINEALSGIIFDGLGIADKNGNNPSYQQSVSNIVGVISGGITNADDQDLGQLGNIAKNGTAYNYLLHKDMEDALSEVKQCGDDSLCRDGVAKKYNDISEQRNQELMSVCEKDINSCVDVINIVLGDQDKIFQFSSDLRGEDTNFAIWAGIQREENYAALTSAVNSHIKSEYGEQAAFAGEILAALAVARKGGGNKISVGKGGSTSKTVASTAIPGRVQSRINIANGRTATTPIRESTGEQASAGFKHVLEGHFDINKLSNSRTIFTIKPDELKFILQSSTVVKSPVTMVSEGYYSRTVDLGKNIGVAQVNGVKVPVFAIKVITDRAGNLITTFPLKEGK